MMVTLMWLVWIGAAVVAYWLGYRDGKQDEKDRSEVVK